MKENEALKLMESLQISHDCEMVKTLDFKATVIKALEDLQQYRAIGTIDEFKALKEKSEPKKPIVKGLVAIDDRRYYCPKCNERLYREHFDVGYCNCGQSIRT